MSDSSYPKVKIGDYIKTPYFDKRKDETGYFYYIVEKITDKGLWVAGHGYSTGIAPQNYDIILPMNEEEINAFKKEEQRLENNRKQIEERQDTILKKINLTRGDFCRFRDAYEEDGLIIVRTRENGVNGFSHAAAKSPLFKNRTNDEYDSTYAYYEFDFSPTTVKEDDN